MKALGMIEVYGYLTAVEALDSALKAANVSLVDVVKVRGGLVSVLVTGDVGAVKAAIDASAAAAERVGKIVSIHVIPRPAEDVEKMLRHHTDESKPTPPGPSGGSDLPEPEPEKPQMAAETVTEDAAEKEDEKIPEDVNVETEIDVEPVSDEAVEADIVPKKTKTLKVKKDSENDPKQVTVEEMREMTVSTLRSLARQLKIDTMSRQEIRFAKKQELIHGILKYLGQEN